MPSGVDPLQSGDTQRIPNDVEGYEWWKYGHGKHTSDRRRNLGAIPITCLTDEEITVKLTHLIIDGYLLWVIGRNVTGVSAILLDGRDCKQLPEYDNSCPNILLLSRGLHCHIELRRLPAIMDQEQLSPLACMAFAVKNYDLKEYPL